MKSTSYWTPLQSLVLSLVAAYLVYSYPPALEYLGVIAAFGLIGMVRVRRGYVQKLLASRFGWRLLKNACLLLAFCGVATVLFKGLQPEHHLAALERTIQLGEQTRWRPVLVDSFSDRREEFFWQLVDREDLLGELEDGRFAVDDAPPEPWLTPEPVRPSANAEAPKPEDEKSTGESSTDGPKSGETDPPLEPGSPGLDMDPERLERIKELLDAYRELPELEPPSHSLESIAIVGQKFQDPGEVSIRVREKDRRLFSFPATLPSEIDHFHPIRHVVWIPVEHTPVFYRVLNRILLFVFWLPGILGTVVGLAVFLGTRLFLFLAAVWRAPVRTIRMIPFVWGSRQFTHGLFSPSEILPGYPLSDRDPELLVGKLLWWDHPVFRSFATMVLRGCSFFTKLAFKLSMPVLYPVVYLAFPISAKRTEATRAVKRHYRSRLVPAGVLLSILTIVIFILKAVVFLNLESFLAWLHEYPELERALLALDYLWTPYELTLWQACSFLSAGLFLLAVSEVDSLYSRLSESGTSRLGGSFRMSLFSTLLRARALLVAYSGICLLILCIPFLREHFSAFTAISLATIEP